jgi:DNA-binding response OmpR family regulator
VGLSEKKRILVVDDDVNVLDQLSEYLTSEGYEVETSETGEEATSKITKRFFNLALLDIKLQDKDGAEVLSKIRVESPRTIVIMVTGYPSLDNAVESLNLGADAYIVKPIRPDELLQYIQVKLREYDDKSSSLLDNTMPSFLELISDGNWWSTVTLAQRLGTSVTLVEKICLFCSLNELAEYRQPQGLVKSKKKSASKTTS